MSKRKSARHAPLIWRGSPKKYPSASQAQREIARLKKARSLIAKAAKLLEKCPSSLALHSEVLHAPDFIGEDIANLKQEA